MFFFTLLEKGCPNNGYTKLPQTILLFGQFVTTLRQNCDIADAGQTCDVLYVAARTACDVTARQASVVAARTTCDVTARQASVDAATQACDVAALARDSWLTARRHRHRQRQ